MRFTIALLIALLLSAATFSYGQTRRRKRPTPKPPQQETPPKADPNAITLLYSEDGRHYYLLDVVKNPATDDLYYNYVVFFDPSTPAGRTALSREIALAKLSAVDLGQVYYVGAVQYQCHLSLKEPNNVRYDQVLWTDGTGNVIVRLQINPKDSAVKDQVAEIATYSEPYLQKIFATLEESNEAERRNLESRIQSLILSGQEDQARQLKFEPRLPKYLPALSLVISGGTKHMSEVLRAAKAVYDKKTRTAK